MWRQSQATCLTDGTPRNREKQLVSGCGVGTPILFQREVMVCAR